MSAKTAVHSNAFNFLSFVQSGVDPRTGQYTVNLALPEIKANDLSGPVVPASLSFNPYNTRDSGFGVGWELRLSQYDADKQVIALSSGETFKVTGSSSTDPTRLLMAEQKIESFHFHRDTPNRYRIVHKSGVVEILGREGDLFLPQSIYSVEGHEVSLRYLPFNNGISRLHTVTDAQGSTLLEINLPTSAVEILLRPDGTPGGGLARFEMKLRNSGSGNEVYEVVLPTADASWRFTYQKVNGLLCITEVKTPVGGHETIVYAGVGHSFPGNARAPLPRVWKHQIRPGFKQPMLEVHYAYDNSELPGSSNNFLGNNAPIGWDDNGLDNLYKAAGRYQYGTTETHYADEVPVRRIERTFNRFHLISEEKTTQGQNIHQVLTTYYADDKLEEPFSNQAPQCQLPRRVESRWGLEGGTWRPENVLTAYDTHGNLTEQTQANGVKERYSYFPAAGIPGECPPDPHGFVRHLHEQTVTPASDREKGAPVLRTRNRYDLMPPVQGTAEDAWLVLTEETLLQVEGDQEHALQHSAYLTFNQPRDPLQHGRREQQAITLNGRTTTTDYAYRKLPSAFAGETVLQTTEILKGFDHGVDGTDTKKTVTLEHSLLHGEPLLTRDDSDVEIRYTYDALLRVTCETVAPDTDYVASRTYRYVLTNADGQQACQEATDVKGVRTLTLFDGLNRVIKEQRQDPDHRTGALAQAFRDTYYATYDALGQRVEDIELDWRSADEEDDLQLRSQYRYDDWGEQRSVVRPDGVEEHEVSDPITQTTTTWIEGMGKTVTHNNLFDKPDNVKRYKQGDEPSDPLAEPYSEHRYHYDGLGRTAHEFDALGYKTAYVYDMFNRMIKTTLPNDDVIERTYAPHSSGELPITLKVTPVDSQQLPVLAGVQAFDGLERLTRLIVGPRIEEYEYNASQRRVSRRITPAKQAIEYVYTPGLPDQPIAVNSHEGEQSLFDYDVKTARLDASQNSEGSHGFDYDSAANLTEHRWKLDGKTWTTGYSHSLKGRQLARSDVNNIQCQYTYGKFTARLENICQESLLAEFEYDPCGRLCRTLCTDTLANTTLTTELEFDDQGREILRTLKVSDKPTRTISQTWQTDDRLSTRHLKTDSQSLLLEEFFYDARGRLNIHIYSGDELPQDRYGHEITQQIFIFDALDNILECQTVFKDGTLDHAEFTYGPDDSCQLKSVSHSHPSYVPQCIEFKYDLNGNMLNDEQGRHLHYDSQGRLLDVSPALGVAETTYRYDSHNHLFGVTRSGEETLRFYQNDRLSNTVTGDIHRQYLYNQDHPLAQQQSGDAGQTLLLMTDGKHSVVGESQGTELRTATYNAYGERSGDSSLQSLLAFNGEVCEETGGWYMLGRGYRAYNPVLMRFHSPDNESPFGAGGINPYQYCLGDPINFSDPTGHSVAWDIAGIGFSAMSLFSGNPLLVFFGVIGMLAGQTALTAGIIGDQKTANDARTVALIAGFAEMGVGMLTRGVGQKASRHLLQRAEDATNPLAGSPFSQRTMDALKNADISLPRFKAKPYSKNTMSALQNSDISLPRATVAPFSPNTMNALPQTDFNLPRATARPFSENTINALERNIPDLRVPKELLTSQPNDNWTMSSKRFWPDGMYLPEYNKAALTIRTV
ncbi:RHS repeat-associated core domain-containing protein [Pseudomonas sp. MPC6]|uniref:RHS repeat domain-containing protein n=1 Tax=Pseudomonas sp. MPC6 TaxID=2498848 RepID=UPI0011106391|nr:RHS repeat-associated core domain-containing protein [Pseudomonas sp. MPC6]QCY12720.1 sugar-binding protein [Pseudomonas sp. MPC6]